MKITFGAAIAALWIAGLVHTGPENAAFAACKDPETNCIDKLNDALKDNAENQSDSTSDALERVKRAGDAVQECGNCALENFKNTMDQFGGSSSQSTDGNDDSNNQTGGGSQ